LRIIFAGTPEFAATSLKTILEHKHDVIAVYTQPDRRAGRGKKLLASDVKQEALRHDIPVYQPLNFKAAEDLETLTKLNADLMIVAAYGIILPLEVLRAPTHGCINIHASLLPRWRGAAPIQRAIQAGDAKTGITIMQMDEGLDTGAMILTKETEISVQDTGGSLHDRLAILGGDAIIDYLALLSSNKVTLTPQDDKQANYATKLSKQEALINWNNKAADIERSIRAFNPWPVAYLETEGQRVRVFEANIATLSRQASPGTVIKKDKQGIVVACSDGAINITSLQLAGAKRITVDQFVNGGKALLEEGCALETSKS
jgi:methionyl-tRNA formyltransferase